jgi:hypothetical protein
MAQTFLNTSGAEVKEMGLWRDSDLSRASGFVLGKSTVLLLYCRWSILGVRAVSPCTAGEYSDVNTPTFGPVLLILQTIK